MKAVAADALGMEALGNRVVVGDGGVLPMERGVEAGNLGQPRPVDHDRPDGLQIMRLMERRERDVALQAVENLLRHENGLIEVRAAMHDAVADCDRMDVKLVAQPRARRMQRGRNVGHCFRGIRSLDQNLAFGRLRGQVRLCSDTFDLAFKLAAEGAGLIDAEELKLDARGPGICNKDGVHGIRPPAG